MYLQPEDAGTYTCIAQNLAGVDTNDAHLEVYTLPTLLEELPEEIIVLAGDVRTLF